MKLNFLESTAAGILLVTLQATSMANTRHSSTSDILSLVPTVHTNQYPSQAAFGAADFSSEDSYSTLQVKSIRTVLKSAQNTSSKHTGQKHADKQGQSGYDINSMPVEECLDPETKALLATSNPQPNLRWATVKKNSRHGHKYLTASIGNRLDSVPHQPFMRRQDQILSSADAWTSLGSHHTLADDLKNKTTK